MIYTRTGGPLGPHRTPCKYKPQLQNEKLNPQTPCQVLNFVGNYFFPSLHQALSLLVRTAPISCIWHYHGCWNNITNETSIASEKLKTHVANPNLPAFCCIEAWIHPFPLESRALSNQMQVYNGAQFKAIWEAPAAGTLPWHPLAPQPDGAC